MYKIILFAFALILNSTAVDVSSAQTTSKADKYNIGEIDVTKIYNDKVQNDEKDKLKAYYLNKFLDLDEETRGLTTQRKYALRDFYLQKVKENGLIEEDKYNSKNISNQELQELENQYEYNTLRRALTAREKYQLAEYYWLKAGEINDETIRKEELLIKVDKEAQAEKALEYYIKAVTLDHKKSKGFMSIRAKQLYDATRQRFYLQQAYRYYLIVKNEEYKNRLAKAIEVDYVKRKLRRDDVYKIENEAIICLLSDYKICTDIDIIK